MQLQTKTLEQQPQVKIMYKILFIIGFVHFLNDSIQSIVPAMFPILEKSLGLTYTQLGLIAFSLNITSSLMQPVVGWYTDKKPYPYALPIGLCFTFLGVLGLAFAPTFNYIIISVIFIGIGSATFHPEGSRVAYMASGGQRGLAQSIYQVGGNTGHALAPLITALVLVPFGQFGAIWFTVAAALAIILLIYISRWYAQQVPLKKKVVSQKSSLQPKKAPQQKILAYAIALLILLVFARSWFSAGLTNFFAFFLIEKFSVSIAQSQVYIFVFLASGVLGTFIGGPLADRFGKKNVILLSMLGSAPLAFLLPFINSTLMYPVLALLGVIINSSFSVTVVYAQELYPGKIGTVSGLIVGLAFGMGAIGSIALGSLADSIGLLKTVLFIATLPLLGILTFFLPSDTKIREVNEQV